MSVIVAVLNGAKTLARLLESIGSQTCRDVEVILIDGGSDDGTLEIIKGYKSLISYWVSEADGGIYHAWNKGLDRARGDWICFLGADDFFWDEKVLERMLPCMDSPERSARLIYGRVMVVSQGGTPLYEVGEPWEVARRKLADVMPLPHPGLMHHRSWFDEYGKFDPSFAIAGDYEMLLRGRLKENAIFIPSMIVAGMAQGGISSTASNALTQLREVRRAQIKWGGRLPGWRLMAAFSRVYIRQALQALIGDRLTYRALDAGRRVLGKSPYWSKL